MIKSFFILMLSSTIGLSQNIYFSKKNYSNSIEFNKNITHLAKQLVIEYQAKDKIEYYDNLFRLHLVAKNYKLSINYLDTAANLILKDTSVNKAIGIGYRLYCQTMNSSSGNASFNKNYTRNFFKTYSTCSPRAIALIDDYFIQTVENIKQGFHDYKSLLHKNNSDSISILEAVQLCRKHCSSIVCSKIQKQSNSILKELDLKKYEINDTLILKTPDGGELSLCIVKNKKNLKPLPVILMFNIYAGTDIVSAKEIANYNYIGIIANTRGKKNSNSKIEPFEHDAIDAYIIINWISKQPWCNGKIGMYGGSYLGFSQWSATKNLHPALKTIVPQVSVGAGIDYPMQNGIFMNYMLQWIHYVTNNKTTDDKDFEDSEKWKALYLNWYKSGCRFRSLDSLNHKPNVIFQRWLNHPTYDSFWQKMTPQKEEFANITIPILSITGYFDDDQLGAMYYYKQHHVWNKQPNHYLIIGPYDHSGAQGFPSETVAGYKIDSIAKIPIQQLVFNWFDYVLKDSLKPKFIKDKVNFEVMGENKWHHVPTINNMSNDTLTFYLSETKVREHFVLQLSKPSSLNYISESVDFSKRINDLNKTIDGFDIPSIITDSLPPSERQLIFESEIFTKEFIYSGAMQANIIASINKKDMDIVLSIYELLDNGQFFKLSEDRQRASLAKDKTTRNLLTPNMIETIPLTNNIIISKKINKGSKLVMVLGVAHNCNWQINYGTGKDVSDETIKDAKDPLMIKWYNSSFVKIPILN